MTKKPRDSLQAELVPEGAFTEPGFLVEKGFGEVRDGKLWLFPEEALFLAERADITLVKDSALPASKARDFFADNHPGFLFRYAAYKDLRTRGYVVKSGAKYGADFRVYEKGVKPSRDQTREHSKFLVWILPQSQEIEMKTLVGINRVAHSVKKRLVLAVVDKEMDVTYIQASRLLM